MRGCLFRIMILGLVFSCAACWGPEAQERPRLLEFSDLAQSGVRIGIVDPDLGPAGRYALDVLKKLRKSNTAAAAAVSGNIVTHESHVRALLDKLLRREIDAAFLYKSDIPAGAGKIDAVEIPAALSVAPEYALARIEGTLYPEAALDFVQWLTAPEQRSVWSRYGFKPLAAAADSVKKLHLPVPGGKEGAVRLTVFAAAVFCGILTEMAPRYKSLSGVDVECEFAGSGKLYQKIEQGAQGEFGADIFLSAAPRYVKALVDSGRADNGRIFMRNDLVVGVVRP